jgi:hypothetical protein
MCDLASLEARIESLEFNQDQHAHRIRAMEKCFDTADSPWWKRLLFRVDGWGPWSRLRQMPHWRPWRRFYTS